jgi:amino acid adenylation domain-containing protein
MGQKLLLSSQQLEEQLMNTVSSGEGCIFPNDYSRELEAKKEYKDLKFELDSKIVQKIKTVTNGSKKNTFLLLLTSFSVLLSKYSDSNKVVIGSNPLSLLQNHETDNSVEVIVSSFDGNDTFKDTVLKTQSLITDSLVNKARMSKLKYKEIVDDQLKTLFIQGNIEELPLFLDGNSLLVFAYESTVEKITVTLKYSVGAYKESSIVNIYKRFIKVLSEFVSNSKLTINEVDLFLEGERAQLESFYKGEEISIEYQKDLMQIFEEEVERNPKKVALISNDKNITYEELNKRSNKIANFLRKKGIVKNTFVGIVSERSIEMVVGIFGILKAGGVYVPLSTDLPKERVQYILEDCDARILLARNNHNLTEVLDGEIIPLEEEYFEREEDNNLQIQTGGRDLMYAMYTSGTTGQPKGVMVTHENVLNTLFSLQYNYPFEKDDVFLMKSTYTFDMSIPELFTWFIKGGSMCILGEGKEKEPAEIIKAIKENGVTHLNFSPSMLEALINFLNDDQLKTLNNVRYIFVGGEIFSKSLAKKCLKLIGNVEVFNMYGPTETTVYATHNKITSTENEITIGRPINNTSIYILDSEKRLRPIGIPGDIYISGPGVSRGYINRQELTADKFVFDTISHTGIMYKSGDVGRYLSSGEIDFHGRLDDQVKIRGYRVEIGEIENVLLKHKCIKNAKIVVRENNVFGKYLCAYLIKENHDESISDSEIRNFLNNYLPSYMLPSHIIFIEEFPVNTNGKIDKKALPLPVKTIENKVQTPTEEKLKRIVSKCLGLTVLDPNENIFEQGVHSLMSIQLTYEINKAFNTSLQVSDIYSSPTITSLANLIVIKTDNSEMWDLVILKSKLENKFNSDMVIETYSVNGKEYIVLLTEVDREEVGTYIKQIECPSNFYPNYILSLIDFKEMPKNLVELFSHKRIKQLNKLNMEKLRINLKENFENFNSKLKDLEVCDVYPAGFLQHAYLDRNYKSAITMELNVENQINIEKINLCLNHVIDEHSILRSILVRNSGNGYNFNEYKISNRDLIFPTVDLSEYDIHSMEAIKDNIKSFLVEELKEQQQLDNILFRAVIVKENEKTYSILLCFDHNIFDAPSKQIIDYTFNKYYGKLVNNVNVTETKGKNIFYKKYLAEIFKETNKVNIRKYKNSEKYKEYKQAVLSTNRQYPDIEQPIIYSEPVCLNIEYDTTMFPSLNMEERNIGISLFVTKELCEILFEQEETPIRIVSNGRSFGKEDYKHLVGDCHTSIPILFNKSLNSPEEAYNLYLEEKRYYDDNSICIGAMTSKVFGDLEVWEIIHRGPINFNYIGEINEVIEKEILETIKNMNLARYPIMVYTIENRVGIVLFNGLPSDKKLHSLEKLTNIPGIEKVEYLRANL